MKLAKFMNIDVDVLIREYLEEELECIYEPDAELRGAFHRVIAWFSVPGKYESGKYDVEE
jgi:hypothetical protein